MAPFALSLVIPARDEAFHLTTGLPLLDRGLARHVGSYEIIVVANGCCDATAEVCRRHGVTCIETPPLPPGAARNVGASHARGAVLAFLDADIVPLGSWFERVGNLTRAPHDLDATLIGWPVRAPDRSGWIAKTWESARLRSVKSARYVNSGNMIVIAGRFRRAGGFDASMVGGEDYELCARMRRGGDRIALDERLAVEHLGEPDSLRAFFRRELFHADSLGTLAAQAAFSPTSFALLAVLVGTFVGLFVGVAASLALGLPEFLVLGLLGPSLLVVAGAVKALGCWPRPRKWGVLMRLWLLSCLMLAARLVGAFADRRRRSASRRDNEWASMG